jgi:hypothetical protein
VIRLVAAANALVFYVGGTVWLARRTRLRGTGANRVAKGVAAWATFVFLSALGPLFFAFCRLILGRREPIGRSRGGQGN